MLRGRLDFKLKQVAFFVGHEKATLPFKNTIMKGRIDYELCADSVDFISISDVNSDEKKYSKKELPVAYV